MRREGDGIIFTQRELMELSFVLNRSMHKYAGDDGGAGDTDEMYQKTQKWSKVFEEESHRRLGMTPYGEPINKG